MKCKWQEALNSFGFDNEWMARLSTAPTRCTASISQSDCTGLALCVHQLRRKTSADLQEGQQSDICTKSASEADISSIVTSIFSLVLLNHGCHQPFVARNSRATSTSLKVVRLTQRGKKSLLGCKLLRKTLQNGRRHRYELCKIPNRYYCITHLSQNL